MATYIGVKRVFRDTLCILTGCDVFGKKASTLSSPTVNPLGLYSFIPFTPQFLSAFVCLTFYMRFGSKGLGRKHSSKRMFVFENDFL